MLNSQITLYSYIEGILILIHIIVLFIIIMFILFFTLTNDKKIEYIGGDRSFDYYYLYFSLSFLIWIFLILQFRCLVSLLHGNTPPFGVWWGA